MTLRGRDPATESVPVEYISSSISLMSSMPYVGIHAGRADISASISFPASEKEILE